MFDNNNKNYELIINGEETKIYITKIFDILDKVEKLVKVSDVNFRHGFLVQKNKSVNTYLFRYNVDIVVTNKDDLVIDTVSSLKPNKVTKKYDDAKNIYILSENTIRFFNITKMKKITFQYVSRKKIKW